MQALLGSNPMVKSVMSNPEHMAKAQEMLRNPEIQKQIGGVISNPTVIAKASEVLNGLQQMNTVQAGGRKRFRKKRSRRRKGGIGANTPEAQYRTSMELPGEMGCPTWTGNKACNLAKQQAFNNPSDMGFAWWDYNMKYLEGRIEEGKLGGAPKVINRLKKWVTYMNDNNASMWPELGWYNEKQEKRRQLVNSRFKSHAINRPQSNIFWSLAGKITNSPPGREGYKGLLTYEESGERRGFISGGGKRKSRRKKRRKSKKRKSRRKKRRKSRRKSRRRRR